MDGEEIGVLLLQSDYHQEFVRLLRLYFAVLALVLSFSSVLTYLLSARLQRVISVPILKLAQTARAVAERKDYGVRAEILEQDEIGQFTEAFNQMLGQIQTQDAALRFSQQKFETLVHSIDGIVWEAEPFDFRFHFDLDFHLIFSLFRYVFAAVDTNNDGKIDFVEYLLQMSALSHGNLNERLSAAFEM